MRLARAGMDKGPSVLPTAADSHAVLPIEETGDAHAADT